MHHIISDGWSLGILFSEGSTLYAAYLQGKKDPLPALAIQYADFAAWQRAQLTSEESERQAQYWRDALSGAPDRLELPTDRVRPQMLEFAGGAVGVEIDAVLSGRLRELSQRNVLTLYLTLMVALALLLSRLSGQDDVVV